MPCRIQNVGLVLDGTIVPLAIATNSEKGNGHFQILIGFDSTKGNGDGISIFMIRFLIVHRGHGQSLTAKGQFRWNEEFHLISKFHFQQGLLDSSIKTIVALLANYNGTALDHVRRINELIVRWHAADTRAGVGGDNISNVMDLTNVTKLGFSQKFVQLIHASTVIGCYQLKGYKKCNKQQDFGTY